MPTPTPVAGNKVSNFSVEENNGTLPNLWYSNSWGVNSSAFTYDSGVAQGGTRSLKAEITSYTSGDAKWFFEPVTVQAGKTYVVSDYYRSSVPTTLHAAFTLTNGTMQYVLLPGHFSLALLAMAATIDRSAPKMSIVSIFLPLAAAIAPE